MRSGTGDEDQATAEERAALEAEFNPEDEELCHAATKIQASFRGHMARKQAPKPGKTDDELSKEMGKLDAKGEELDDELADIDLTDPELNKAATKIQASFRGHKVRKDVGPNDKDEEKGNE
ncbi:uncharacterized protein [Hetaerina americana]|uniref:uncharacterized protein n=1 Tax=Hetaerina americana TaxID=62018 RepID=UPI003A7F5961